MEKIKRNKNFILPTLLLIAFPLLLTWIFFRVQQEERYEISVIVGEADSERWAVMQQGLENAAKDFNAQMNFYTISDIRNASEQTALILREIEKQTDALIIDAVDSEALTEVLQNQNINSKIVLMETDLQPELLFPQVIADNYKIGCDLGEQIIMDKVKSIGILMVNDSTIACKERMQGLKDTIEKDKSIQINWSVSNQNRLTRANWYFDNIETDAIVALDSNSTKESVSIVQEGSKADTRIYGIGNTESNIYYLDKGVITALVIPNEYNMGYFSMQKAIQRITAQPSENTLIVNHIIVTKKTLYEEDTQRLVFPFVQ